MGKSSMSDSMVMVDNPDNPEPDSTTFEGKTRDVTPPKKLVLGAEDDDLEDSDEEWEDETLLERIIGLNEMFPSSVRNFVSKSFSTSYSAGKGFYSFACNGLWILACSGTMLVLPVLFEMERAQMEEQQMQQQRQILLGPNAASSGPITTPGMMPMPQRS